MTKYLLILLLLPFLASGQEKVNHTDSNGLKQGWWKKEYPNGKTIYEGRFLDDKPVGEWRRYHENGVLRAILLHHQNSDSVQSRLFDTSGKPAAEGYYTGEKKTGLWKYYSEGKIVSEETYSSGEKSGPGRLFYPTGEVLEETEWSNGVQHGKYRAFFQSGKPFLECIYQNGKRNGFCISYYPAGSMEVEAFYKDDLPDGEWKYYSDKNELRFTLQYSNGVLLNPEVLYKIETQQLEELERRGKKMADPEKYLDNPTEYLLKYQ
jgi:antitoxin component YwqK of YwqJK toxin-antitoxin module